MHATVKTIAFVGIQTIDVDVEAHITSGLNAINIVGLPDKALKESKERVKSAINALGLSLPIGRTTINLAPADLAKEGSHYDLPIALAILAAMRIIPSNTISDFLALGELSLHGSIKKSIGVLPAAIHASSCNKGVVCPHENGNEAAWAGKNVEILAPKNLISLVNHFKGTQLLTRPEANISSSVKKYPDLKDIKGQETARRALEIAASGGHNMLMVGPPGSGKSMLASRFPGIMPELTSKEMLNVSMIASIAGQLTNGQLQSQRPFRDPHHSCSMASMVGGGKTAKPGEITLAHNGILFLDELPEFPKNVLESLRQPMESGKITVSRVQAHITYPSDFQLIAAMNPCRCGYLGDPVQGCNRAPQCGAVYQAKISGPIFDRIDIHIEVPAIKPAELANLQEGESSEIVRKRVERTLSIQKERYKNYGISNNSRANGQVLEKFSTPDDKGKELINKAMEQLNLSMRGYNRVLKVARTIADMENSSQVGSAHIAEALNYRRILLQS